tara:strand:- start:508 stop:1242 length:735 start_codon:yes stop_codon:yes gene_type:complete
MKKRKIIRRKPGQKRNMYFTKDTQASIEEYQQEPDRSKREQIYKKDIAPAFEQLSESLIYVYGFNSPYETVTSMKVDCVAFLYETIHKWDPARGTKAFSYFNVVAKNWLIIRCRNAKKQYHRHVSMSEMSNLSTRDKNTIANYQVVPGPDVILERKNFKNELMQVIKELETRVKKQNEVLCVDAIKTVFDNVDNLDFLNKRAIYVYIREISGLNSKQLSVAMSKIRKHYKAIISEGELIDFGIF